jgi:hypothetical protein
MGFLESSEIVLNLRRAFPVESCGGKDAGNQVDFRTAPGHLHLAESDDGFQI